MTEKKAIELIWDYMLMGHEIQKSDVIFVLGNRDVRVAERAAELYLQGFAPVLICAGSGTIHNHKPGREQFIGTTEAELFAEIAMNMGVPRKNIVIENQSQNTGQNYEFAIQKLKERNITPKKVILVQKPYMERRTYATGKVWLPDVDLCVTSPQISFEDYPTGNRSKEQVINAIVGDLERIIEYPKLGFQVRQDVPSDVKDAFDYLVSRGYTERMIKK